MLDALVQGTDLERQALVDGLANERATVRLLPWTAGWATQFGALVGTRAGTGWGGSTTAPRLDHVLADQARYADAWTRQPHEVLWKSPPLPLTTHGDLQALPERSARTASRTGDATQRPRLGLAGPAGRIRTLDP